MFVAFSCHPHSRVLILGCMSPRVTALKSSAFTLGYGPSARYRALGEGRTQTMWNSNRVDEMEAGNRDRLSAFNYAPDYVSFIGNLSLATEVSFICHPDP
jgi:hypothetical protein